MKSILEKCKGLIVNEEDFIWLEKTDGSFALINTTNNVDQLFEINGLSSQFFKSFLEGTCPSHPLASICKKYEVSEDIVLKDLTSFVSDLEKNKILVNKI